MRRLRTAWPNLPLTAPQGREERRIYDEPRCVEGNYAFPSMMLAARQADRSLFEGRGPDPATRDNVSTLVDIDTSVVRDP